MRGLNTFETFIAIMAQARATRRPPDAIVATGDLVQDETRQGYQRFRQVVSLMGVPVHCIPGNHDAPRIMAELLNHPPFQFCGIAHYGNWCLVMLNSACRGDDGGYLDGEQLAALDRTLAANTAHHVLVCLHHHPIPMESRWLDGVGLRGSQAFLDVIDRHSHVRCIAWGHVHQASDRERKGIRMISTPSTGSQFLPGSDTFAVDSKPPGFRWLELHADGSIETEVEWLKQPIP